MTNAQISDAIHRHRGTVRFALIQSGIPERDIDDVTQDVLTVFFRRFDAIAEPAQRAFLLGTARRMAADHRRRKWNRPLFTPLDAKSADPDRLSPGMLVERCQLQGLASEALSALPAAEKTVFLLAQWEDLSRAEIAARLAIPSGTVASRFARASRLYSEAFAKLSRLSGDTARAIEVSHGWMAPGRSLDCVVMPRNLAEHEVGPYHYVNNQWGRVRAEGGYDQCLLSRRTAGELELGWSWNWPGFHRSGFALPEIVFGWKPWSGGRPTDDRFPLALCRVEHLQVEYDVEQNARGAHELILNIWMLSHPGTDCLANPELISSEIIVTFDRSDEFPQSAFMSQVRLGGESYRLWIGSEVQGPRIEPWPQCTLCRVEGRTSGRFDVKELLDHLLVQGHLSPADWIGSIEFGTAILGGSGTTWVRKFELDLAVR